MLCLQSLGINRSSFEEIKHRLVSSGKILVGRHVTGNSLSDSSPVIREFFHRVNRQHFLVNVLSEIKFDVFANPNVSDLHLVKGECASLVRADVSGTAHNLASSQFLHIVVVLKHLTLRVGKRDHDSKRETFGDSDDDNGDTDDDVVNPEFKVVGKGTAFILNFTTEKIEVTLGNSGREAHEWSEGQRRYQSYRFQWQ